MKRSIKRFIKQSAKQITQQFVKSPGRHLLKTPVRSAKQFALRAAAVFTVCGLLTGCAAQNGSAAYEKLLSYKTDGYLSLSVAGFNALIAPTRDALGEALDAYAEVTVSKEDENCDFFDVTLRASLSELYGEVFEEPAYFSVVLSRQERPYVNPIDGYVFYEFWFYANVDIEYYVTSPETLTVAERDSVLRSCREELQSYVESLSEEEILYGNIRAALTGKAAELERRYTGNGMELSIEIGLIDMPCER